MFNNLKLKKTLNKQLRKNPANPGDLHGCCVSRGLALVLCRQSLRPAFGYAMRQRHHGFHGGFDSQGS